MTRVVVAVVVIVCCASTLPRVRASAAGQTKPPPKAEQHGRLFAPTDLGLLEAPDRNIWQQPEQIMDELGIAEASVVADVGAGSGWFTVHLARRVGPNGIVYAQDVQQEMLNAIFRRVQREGLSNVQTRLGEGSDPKLPLGRLDAILIVGVYHEIEDRVTMLKNLGAALKPQGRIGVIDFTLTPPGGPGPPTDERVDPRIVITDAANAGLRLVSQETFLPYQYFLIFGRENRQTAGSTALAIQTFTRSARTKG